MSDSAKSHKELANTFLKLIKKYFLNFPVSLFENEAKELTNYQKERVFVSKKQTDGNKSFQLEPNLGEHKQFVC